MAVLFQGQLNLGAKCLDHQGNPNAVPILAIPNGSPSQQWILYDVADNSILQPVSLGWVALQTTDLLMPPASAWKDPSAPNQWTLLPNGMLQAGDGPNVLQPTADGASVMLAPPTLPVWNFSAQATPPAAWSPAYLGEFGEDAVVFSTSYLAGRKVDFKVIFSDPNTLSASWAISQEAQPVPLMVSLCLVPNGGTLAAAVAGTYDSLYQAAAANLAQWGLPGQRGGDASNALLMFRIGWEMNASWYPWAAAGNEADYIAAFQRYHDILKAACPGAVFVWCSSRGIQAVDPETCYPGDAYVDWIGLDCYEQSQYDTSSDSAARFASIRSDGNRSLDWVVSFAAAHNKPVCFPEWGSNYNDGAYMTEMAAFLRTAKPIGQSVWDNSSATGDFAFADHPVNAAAYTAGFKNWPNA